MLENEIAKQLAVLDQALLDMGDSYTEIAYNLCAITGIEFDWDRGCEDGYNESKSIEAYTKILSNSGEYNLGIQDSIRYFEENIERLICETVYYQKDYGEVNGIRHALSMIADYAKQLYNEGHIDQETCDTAVGHLNLMDGLDFDICLFGYRVGREFFKYQPSDFVNVRTNDVHTVGHVLTGFDDEAGLGQYVAHSDLNSIKLPNEEGCSIVFSRRKNEHPGNGVRIAFYFYKRDYKASKTELTDVQAEIVLNLEPEDIDIEWISKDICGVLEQLFRKRYGHLLIED